MMDVQMAPPPYTAAGNFAPPVGKPPVLGSQIPGTTGGLPAAAGLSATTNPMANQLQSMGRGEDSMLVHMTPDEVNSLQGLALASGGSLTINPQTGLPEAGWLGKLLPTILGAALAATGVGAPLAAGIVGAGQFARTGSLKKGLMAGLGAFGGAGMAGMAGLGGKISSNALGILGDKPGMFGANMGLGTATKTAAQLAAPTAVTADPLANASALQAAGPVNIPASGIAGGPGATTLGAPAVAAPTAVNPMQAAINNPLGEFSRQANALYGGAPTGPTALPGGGAQFTGGLGSRFAQATRAGLPAGTPGMLTRAAPMMAGMGVLNNVSSAMTPSMGSMGSDGIVDNSYAGPYAVQRRTATFAPSTDELLSSSAERRYFDIDMPEVYNTSGQIVRPGSSTAPGTPILQNILNPNARKGQNRYTPTLIPYMGGPAQDEEDMGYAGGGEVELSDGAFVLDARTVSELGNGSSNAGLEALRRIGGRPVQGPGDGVSDSVPARIGRDQPARVARDEAIIPADAVRRLGKGNPKKGADKLYSLMNKAHKARKKAKRGQDTKVRRGLG
jgi:hypothetical protein